ncbi:hypothetical protein RRF57_000515 [Xylaria bambusicola]|uniref:Uncharacterized protein n=1 Tax=Xylaria bambusicola TaxID=326684 RepID=A0AAN7UNR4_9PEZI
MSILLFFSTEGWQKEDESKRQPRQGSWHGDWDNLKISGGLTNDLITIAASIDSIGWANGSSPKVGTICVTDHSLCDSFSMRVVAKEF